MERKPFLAQWPAGESLTVAHTATPDHDMLTINWMTQEGSSTEGYVRIGALDNELRKAVFKCLAAGPPPPSPIEEVDLTGIDLPQMGATYVLGGQGPVIISFQSNRLIIRTDDVNGARITEYLPIKTLRRTESGVSFIDVNNKQHVFTFVERPVNYILPQWEVIPVGQDINLQ
jgi:hypothetical protein